jgi:multidrug transporter EmrE-like cation transporter
VKHSLTFGVILLLIASGVMFGAGEFLSKKFAQAPGIIAALLTIGAYVICELFWLPALAKTNTLAITGTIWNVMAFIGTIFIGMVLFKETLSPVAYWGIAFGLVSVLLLSLA